MKREVEDGLWHVHARSHHNPGALLCTVNSNIISVALQLELPVRVGRVTANEPRDVKTRSLPVWEYPAHPCTLPQPVPHRPWAHVPQTPASDQRVLVESSGDVTELVGADEGNFRLDAVM
jgi:hypothetical protein